MADFADPVNEPINKSSDYLAMLNYWDLIDALRSGVQALRTAGTKYLPRFQNENPTEDPTGRPYDPYEERRLHAPLTNIYLDISQGLSSKPFAKTCELVEDTADNYKQLSENIDGQGNSLHVFAQDVFQTGIDYAVSWILVDFPKAIPRADGQPLSMTEEADQGLRPYWTHIHPTRLFAVYSDFVGGTEIIVHARISEPTMKLEGYIERTIQRVRVINRDPVAWDEAGKPIAYGPAQWALFENVVDATNNTQSWIIVDQGEYSIGIVPLIPFVTGRRKENSWVMEPPLQAIAYLQIEDYQQESNLKTIEQLTCFPMLSGDGVTPDENGKKVPVGPRAVLFGGSSVDGRPGSWHFIEPQAASLKHLQDKLQKTQNDMRDLGFQPLTMQNLTVITTGQVAVKANSAVQAWAIKFKDALEQAWLITAAWLNRPNDQIEVSLYMDFNVGLDNGQGWTAAWNMRTNKDISHETILGVAKRYGYLPDDFDMEQNDEELATEAEKLQAEQMIDPITGKPIQLKNGGPPGQPGKPMPPEPRPGNLRSTQRAAARQQARRGQLQ